MRRLVCACVVRKPPKTGFLTLRPIWNRDFIQKLLLRISYIKEQLLIFNFTQKWKYLLLKHTKLCYLQTSQCDVSCRNKASWLTTRQFLWSFLFDKWGLVLLLLFFLFHKYQYQYLMNTYPRIQSILYFSLILINTYPRIQSILYLSQNLLNTQPRVSQILNPGLYHF